VPQDKGQSRDLVNANETSGFMRARDILAR
jgi:hypothetical protein